MPTPPDDAHEIRHRRAFVVGAGRFRILLIVNVGDDDIVVRINVIAVTAGGMLNIFLGDLVLTRRRVEALAPGRELRDPDQLSALVKIRALLAKADLDRGFPGTPRHPNRKRCRPARLKRPANPRKRRRDTASVHKPAADRRHRSRPKRRLRGQWRPPEEKREKSEETGIFTAGSANNAGGFGKSR